MNNHRAQKVGPGRRFTASAACLLAITLLLPSCAANRAYKAGLRAERAERYADAIRYYSEATARKPEEPRYRMALSTALMKSCEAHLKRGEALERGGEYELAYQEFRNAFAENPWSDVALLKRDMVHKLLLARAAPEKTPTEAPIVSPLAQLPTEPVNLKLSDAELTEVFASIERLTGITFIYDEAFKSRKVTVNFQQTSFREVLDRLMLTQHLFYKLIDSRTILIANDTEAKRAEYAEQAVKTFYLHNAEATKVAANLKSMVDLNRVMVNPELKAITIKDSAEKLEFARRLIEKEDMRRAEVVVDMEILEFNRNRLRQYGLDFSSYAVGGAIALEPVTKFPEASLIRGHMLGHIELSDIIFSIPSVIYRLLRTDTHTRLIARPQLRAAESETAAIKIGDRVPVPVTTFVPVAGGGVNDQPITSFQYVDIGLSIELTPEVHYNGEVSLKCKFELTSIVREGTATLPPTIGNRTVTSTIRLKDGETTLIAGLIRDEERRSRSGLPGISDLPVLGHLLASNQETRDQTDLVFTMTPHIVRLAEVGEEERRPIWVGTEKQLRISEEPPRFVEVDKSRSPVVGETQPETTPAQPRPPGGAPSRPETPPTPPHEEPRTGNREPETILFDPMQVVVPLGQEFSMQIRGQSFEPNAQCSFQVVFDRAILTLIRIEPGRRVADSFRSDMRNGVAWISFVSGKDFDGDVCSVVLTGKAPGSTQLLIDGASVIDATGTPSKVSFVPASVRVAGDRGSI
ncbi:MAG: secretin N-terminal domain-containing protein [Acidobacteriota bacterium]